MAISYWLRDEALYPKAAAALGMSLDAFLEQLEAWSRPPRRDDGRIAGTEYRWIDLLARDDLASEVVFFPGAPYWAPSMLRYVGTSRLPESRRDAALLAPAGRETAMEAFLERLANQGAAEAI